jgi:hypothetical protein
MRRRSARAVLGAIDPEETFTASENLSRGNSVASGLKRHEPAGKSGCIGREMPQRRLTDFTELVRRRQY